MTNIIGALVTMPHKIATCDLVQRLSPTAAIAGACNAIRREADGSLSGDMFDGEGFVLGLRRKGFNPQGTRALVVGSGGVGSAIAASLAAAGVSALTLDRYPAQGGARPRRAAASALSAARYHPDAARSCRARAGGQCHPAGDEGQRSAAAGRRPSGAWRLGGEVVMTQEYTPLLRAAQARQCHIQRGTDMLFEMIPAYLRFFRPDRSHPRAAAGAGRNSLLTRRQTG